MEVQILTASTENKQIISNLMQFYMYDFSEYTEADVEDSGLFTAYPQLEEYWREADQRFPYIVRCGEKRIGFVFVRRIETPEREYFSIAEFYIMRKYRRKGLGRNVAKEIFKIHRGQWEVYQMEANKPEHIFWKEIISAYTEGHFI